MKLSGSLRGIACELGIDERTLRRWAQQYHKPTSVSGLKQADQLEQEALVRCLRKRVGELEKDVKLLTNVTVFLPTKKQVKY